MAIGATETIFVWEEYIYDKSKRHRQTTQDHRNDRLKKKKKQKTMEKTTKTKIILQNEILIMHLLLKYNASNVWI